VVKGEENVISWDKLAKASFVPTVETLPCVYFLLLFFFSPWIPLMGEQEKKGINQLIEERA